jgi:hypothetical protein
MDVGREGLPLVKPRVEREDRELILTIVQL